MMTKRGNNARRLRLRRRRSRRQAGNKAFTKKFRKFLADALKPRRIIFFSTTSDDTLPVTLREDAAGIVVERIG